MLAAFGAGLGCERVQSCEFHGEDSVCGVMLGLPSLDSVPNVWDGVYHVPEVLYRMDSDICLELVCCVVDLVFADLAVERGFWKILGGIVGRKKVFTEGVESPMVEIVHSSEVLSGVRTVFERANLDGRIPNFCGSQPFSVMYLTLRMTLDISMGRHQDTSSSDGLLKS